MTSKLVLLLANHIGDEQLIREAIALARGPMRDKGVAFASLAETE